MQDRYSRQEVLPELGRTGQKKLRESHVLLVGVGGLGCPILQYLVAAGVGRITLMDDDIVDISNLQRQILFTEKEAGLKKVVVAREKMEAINSEVSIQAIPERLNVVNARELFPACDLVIDGSDNFGTSYLVNDACAEFGVPFVFGSLFQFEGQVTLCNVAGGATYRCLFPEPPAPEDAPTCAEAGILGSVAGTVACIMAQEALKYLAEFGELLSGRLLRINLKDFSTQIISFARNENLNTRLQEQSAYDALNSCSLVTEISFEELQSLLQKEEVYLVDVREAEERELFHIGGVHCPLSRLDESGFPSEMKLVFYCKSGARSQKAAVRTLAKGSFPEGVFSLAGGVSVLPQSFYVA